MIGIDFSKDPLKIMRAIEFFLHTEYGRLIPCMNTGEVLKQIELFLTLAEKYGWYCHYKEIEKVSNVPEDPFVLVQIHWRCLGDDEYNYMTIMLAINPQFNIIIDHYLYPEHLKKCAIVCRRRDHTLSKNMIGTGIKEVRFPVPLVAATVYFSQDFNIPGHGWVIDDKVITYSLMRLKSPKVPDKNLPLYINANPVVKASIDLEKKLRG